MFTHIATIIILGIKAGLRLTDMAKNKDKRNWILNTLRVATWNVRGMAMKEEEFDRVMKATRIDFAAAPETKKKLQGSKYVDDYVMLHSGVKQKERACKGIALFIAKRWENKIKDYKYINDRIIVAKVKGERRNLQ